MSIRLSKLEMPKRLVKEASKMTATHGVFTVEPLETGFGRTIGNSLRRMLLSSIEGAAITAVRIEGARHEFCAVPGVVEDVTDIILNLKRVLLKMQSRESRVLSLKKKGPCEVKAGDIKTDGTVEVLNPELHLATLAEDGELDMQIECRVGRGFCPAEWNKVENQDIGRIPIDSIFSPVRLVNFMVDATRVGQRTDYDKLEIDITTDGRITPEDALTVSAALLQKHLDVFVNFDRNVIEFEEEAKHVDAERERLRKILSMSVNEIELSVRAANCLNNANITTVGELVQKSEAEMLKFRNFGRKSLNEIVAKLEELELHLDMTFDEALLRSLTPPPSAEVAEKG